jgi:serpin B
MHQPLVGQVAPYFKYMQSADFQALELPYASNQVSMLLLLPTQIDGLGQLEQKLTPALLSNVLAQMLLQQVEVFLTTIHQRVFLQFKSNFRSDGHDGRLRAGGSRLFRHGRNA